MNKDQSYKLSSIQHFVVLILQIGDLWLRNIKGINFYQWIFLFQHLALLALLQMHKNKIFLLSSGQK
jgi:hypothetical protein